MPDRHRTFVRDLAATHRALGSIIPARAILSDFACQECEYRLTEAELYQPSDAAEVECPSCGSIDLDIVA